MPANARPRTTGSKASGKTTTAPKSTVSKEPTKKLESNTQATNNPYASIDPSNFPTSPPPASQKPQTNKQPEDGTSTNPPANPAPTVNRKKQKRREKQAARIAAEQQLPAANKAAKPATNGAYPKFAYGLADPPPAVNGFDYAPSDYEDADQYEPAEGEDLYYTDDDGHLYEKPFGIPPNGFLPHPTLGQQSIDKHSKKKGKGKERTTFQQAYHASFTAPIPSHLHPPPPPPPPPATQSSRSAHRIAKDRIWNTSTQEERERIKEFWLSLGEEERRSLVKVEKEAVLKKMKEQQKHSCSCTVCGRKRTAIEEELEVLYDAYYEELEQYANHQQISLVDGTPIMPPAELPHPTSRFPPSHNPHPMTYHRPSRGRIQEIPADEDETEEEYSEEEDEDEDEEYDSQGHPEEDEDNLQPPTNDFFNFGNSLTVQGGILTVADDLLKNDGKKFIEMMEQLAERRMQREEDAQYAAAASMPNSAMPPHNHGPPLEDDGYDDEEDEESLESGDEDYDEDEIETMTEEQRMEEGRRMFQIFAARMFEQRVLTAYREKVAAERQQKLIEELEEESRLDTQREAKKAKEAQKRKDKKRQLKQKQDEDKAQREAKKAAEEAAARAAEEKKQEEQRQRKEEQRKKKEAEKKAQDEERQRKETEKQKRLQEAREQQAEQERKQREQKEREKKKRDEAKKKEREEKEAKEKAAAEKKEREAAERREQEAKAKAEKATKEQARKQEQSSRLNSTIVAVPATDASNSKPTRPPAQTRSSHASPHLQIATPVVPKAPTPFRARQSSFQDPHASSPKTSQPPSTTSATPPGFSGQPQPITTPITVKPGQGLHQQSQHTPPFHPSTGASTAISQPPGLPPMSSMGGGGFPSHFGPMMAGATQRGPMQEPFYGHQPPLGSPQQRQFMPQGGLPFPPGINGIRQMPPNRGSIDLPTTQGLPGQIPPNQSSNTQYVISRDTMPSHSKTHSRQTSVSHETSSYDLPNLSAVTQPIARPTPIQRPPSVTPHQQGERERFGRSEISDLANHLGSSALLDDTDVPLTSASHNNPRRGSVAPGGPFRQGFGGSPMFPDPVGATKMDAFQRGSQGGNGNTWSAPHAPFGAPPMSGPPQWAHAPGSGWPSNNAFGIIGSSNRPNASRAVTIRLLVCQACNRLTANQPTSHKNGFHPVESVLRQVELMKPANEGTISQQEMLDICDTEGNSQNGGGSFIVESHGGTERFVKFDSGRNASVSGLMRRGVPGDIGSPLPGSSFAGFGGGSRPFQQSGGF
ncbi:MAG: hypothetical protein LQ350_006592 [Teloschistes chrysophthalmus]|nr:MAG: hypothetical protein LQ350_006592 [Niorma chrysophthalma]